jgi:dTMP kinase
VTEQARYVAFEGGEGSGKSTQARLLAERVGGIVTFEPGGTVLGQELRRLLLHSEKAPLGPRAETLLMAADRAQHLDQVVLPSLDSGRHVVSDRSAYSSLAYQGGGRGLGIEPVREINDWAVAGRWPDAVVLLEVSADAAAARLDRDLDRLEREAGAFHQAVRRTFGELAAADPDHWHVIKADEPIDDVAAAIWEALCPLFEGQARP